MIVPLRFAAFLAALFQTLILRAETRLPNIVIIFTDDQGYADVGVFGAKGFTTPNLDRLAAEGRKFTNFHVAQPVCSASRAALLTGCYPNRIGIHGALGPAATRGIADGEMTLAELVKQKGYATGMAGKWHLGRPAQFLPTHHGFDEYFGLPYSNDMWPLHPEAKAGTYPPLPLIEGDRVLKEELTHEDQAQLTTQYTERAVRFIEKNKDRPFLLYVAHNMPHVPLHVSDKFKGKSARGLYGDVIEEIDWSVGEILAALKRSGIEENTWVIFTSDNGPWLSYGEHAGSAAPLREGKGTNWEGGTREPCIMRWPGKISADSTCDTMLMTIDLFPTIAKLIGAELPAHKIDGLDVWPIIAGEPGAKNRHDAYFFYYENNQLQAVTSGDGRWKLQLPHTWRTLGEKSGGKDGVPAKYEQRKVTQLELYDLQNDVSETTDVAAQNPEIVKHLEALAEQARADLGDTLTSREGAGVREPGSVAGKAGAGVAQHPTWATKIEKPGLPNLHCVSANLYRGAQPTAEGMRTLQEMGIKTVINLRGFHSDRKEAAGTPLALEAISFKTWHPENEDIVRFLRLVTDHPRGPIFVHCQHGADRTGLMIAIYRVAVDGWTKRDAIDEMTKGDFGFHSVWKNLIAYFEKLDIAALKQRAESSN
jgi:arylsulfatase